ncbi:MAG: ribosome biogenesis GTPase Der [Deltaproteobacteria bacterium]|nr:ribosome biogenesis GTPase Der [Deltaproteobacteria bacterium]
MTQAATESIVLSAPPRRLPVVAIVGRPNVGKSTFFNRLIRQRKAVVDNTPGVTRDRNFAQAIWDDIPFLLVDTGGIDLTETNGLVGHVQEQTRLAIDEADSVIFLFDGREGLNPVDADAVDLLRRSKKPVFFAANKVEGEKQELAVSEFFSLGLDSVFPISASHGRGIGELMEAVIETFPREPEAETEDASLAPLDEAARLQVAAAPLQVAIVGRPNAGKSSLLNRLVGFERSIVDAVPGTTRDAIDSQIEWKGRPIVLVDTAGARRRTRIHERIEHASVMIALRSLERAEIGVLVLDGVEGMADQDSRIAQYAWERGRGLILVINKWDAVPPERKNQGRYLSDLHDFFPVTKPLPVVFISALTGAGINKVLPTLEKAARAHSIQIPTAVLNRHLQEWTRRNPPSSYRGKQPRLFYATQVRTKPLTIAIFTGTPEGLQASYIRYLENQMRDTFDLQGTPIKLSFRARRKERADENKA